MFTDKEPFLNERSSFPDVHQMILCDLSDLRVLEQNIKQLQNNGRQIELIVSFLESHVHTAALLSEKFCRSILSTEAIMKMEDKILTRKALQHTSYCPYFTTWEPQESLSACLQRTASRLPLVVKSPTSTGSKDVLKAETQAQWESALTKMRTKFPDQKLLIEEYLDGPQFLVEAVVVEGETHMVAVIEQDIRLFSRFIVMGYDVLTYADMDREFREEIKIAVDEIVEGFEMRNGALHLEMRYVKGAWKLIEANPRISGGAMNRMIEVAKGINLLEETLKFLLGEEPNLTIRQERNTYTQYVTVNQTGILESVSGRNRAARMEGVAEVFLKPRRGQKVRYPESMGHRYAYVIATGDSRAQARENARRAAREIQFHTR
ncbi:ATP-grasp domain-containing protein [Tumebacillus flagellatus]|uniref:ATP-grasp domain-containing protein n=1 Tax=Tumebacillus flagellatus TaxID=1157490 RepID=UPI00068F5F10|nr:ATP-grasp domain-containing protein [Tumebacillus flagellatus]